MVGEVISLLSSPSIGPIPPPPAPPKRATPPAPSHLEFLSDDFFDLTGASPTHTISHGNPSIPASKKSPPKKQSNQPLSKEVFFLSDDFDTTGDLDKSLDWIDPPRQAASNKRRRISPSAGTHRAPFGHSQSAVVASSHSSIQQAKGLQRAQALADPIEFSSSPCGPPSAQPRRVNSHDPFASTPLNPPSISNQSQPIPPSSADPFASDPPAAPLPPTRPTSKPTAAPVIEIDDDDLYSDPFASSPKVPPARTSTKTTTAPVTKPKSPRKTAAWDPISSSAPELNTRPDSFDSSPPLYRSKKPASRAPAVIDLSDSEVSTHGAGPTAGYGDEEFPDIADMDMSKYRNERRLSPLLDVSPPNPRVSRPKPKASASATSKLSAEGKARARELKNAEKEAERERKRLEKEAAKELKAKEKERAAALAEVNKVRTDKKVSTPEMIVDLPQSLPPALALQAQELLKDLDVEYSTWHSPVDNVVKWRRKVRSSFNDDLGMWEPMPLRISNESYALVVVVAPEFVKMALGAEGEDLEAHVTQMKSHFPGLQLIYLIDGLTPWMRKNRNVRNRQFVSAVRQEAEGANPPSSTARRRKNQAPQEYIDEDMVEDALLQLQVVHGVQIHHTAAPVETAQWIAVFTQHISTVPYRKQKEAANAAGAGFCMESGQVRTGEDVKDTYTKLLQEIVRVTAPIAYGIATEFDTVSALVRGLEEGGPLALEGCRKSANKDGGLSDRAVGQAVSRRIHRVFTGRDETSTDV